MVKNKFKNRNWLYLPIEAKTREFNAKLFMAFEAAEAGYCVLVGYRINIIRSLSFLPKGIFSYMHAIAQDSAIFKKCKKQGFKTVAVDEEGPFYFDDEKHKSLRISSESLENIDCFFSWGQKELELNISKVPEAKDKIIISGNPRFDLIRKELNSYLQNNAKKLVEKYGKIILVNTNLSMSNHYLGVNKFYEMLEVNNKLATKESRDYYNKYIDYQSKVYEEFVKMIESLSEEFQNYKIILRPHPGESHDTWKGRLKNLKNVEVINEGNVLYWIMASEFLIHNNCTTGIEAYLLEKPAVSYRPVRYSEHDNFLPNMVNKNVFSQEELISEIKECFEKKQNNWPVTREGIALIKYFADSIEGKFAYEKMLEIIDTLKIEHNIFEKLKRNNFLYKLCGLYFSFKGFVRIILKGRRGLEYERHKFPGIEIHEAEELRSSLRGATDKYKNIKIKKYGRNCIKIYCEENLDL